MEIINEVDVLNKFFFLTHVCTIKNVKERKCIFMNAFRRECEH